MTRAPCRLVLLLLAVAGCIRTDPASVRDFVKERINEQFPGVEIRKEGEEKLQVRFPGGATQTVNIAGVQEGCRSVPRQCAAQVSRLLIVMQEGSAAQNAEFDPGDIRPRLRSAARPAVAAVVEDGAGEPIHESLAEGLEVAYGIPTGDAITMVDAALARKMGIEPAKLRALAAANLARDPLPNFSSFPGQAGVFQVSGKGSLAILFSSRHREEAQRRLSAREIALALPRPGLMLVSDAADPQALIRLRETAARFNQSAAARLSDQVYLLSERSLTLIKP